MRDGAAAVRVATGAAALDTGTLAALADGSLSTAALAARLGAVDDGLLLGWLRALEAQGWLGQARGQWSLRPAARRLLDDEVQQAAYAAFSGYHTGLYRDLAAQLRGGPARRDVAEQGATIAQLSRGFDPFVHEWLRGVVHELTPRTVLDVGCGAGNNLAAMLRAAPDARGVGVEVDDAAADLAESRFRVEDLAARATVVRGDVGELVSRGHAGGPYDVALLANVIYYLPLAQRAPLLAQVAGLLAPGGALLVVTTAAEPDAFSRHFDLLLRAQGTGARRDGMELPEVDALCGQLAQAGLSPGAPQRLAPGQPLVAVLARR